MSSRHKLALIIPLVTLVFVSILGFYQAASAQTSFEVYDNPDYDIRIQYPSDWTVKQDNLAPYQVVRFSAPEIREQETSLHTIIYIPASVAVAVQQLDSTNVTADQFIEQFFDYAYTSPSEFRIIETSNTTLAGINAKKIIMYEYLSGDNSKVMRIIGIQNGTAYLIKYAAEPGRYDEYLPTAQGMIDSFIISPVDTVSTPSQTSVPSPIQIDNGTADSRAGASQNQSEPVLLQPRSREDSLIELPNRLIVTDDVLGDNRLPLKADVINGQLNEFADQGATTGELYRFYPVVRFHFDNPSQIGLVNVKHLLLGPVKSYDSPSDILEDSRYYANIPLNEQVVLELDQPGLNYFIASVQFTNGTTGVYTNIMDNQGHGTKSAAEDFLEYKMDQGEDYNILEDSDIDDIQSDPIFQQIASNIICSDLKEYGFQVCEQSTEAAAPTPNQPSLPVPNSIFEDENAENDNDQDNGDDDNGDDEDDND